jgi:hypothetical protein
MKGSGSTRRNATTDYKGGETTVAAGVFFFTKDMNNRLPWEAKK